MILDQALRVADAQVVTGTARSTNSIDLGEVPPRAGPRVTALLTVDVTALTATSLIVQIITAVTPDLLTGLRIVGQSNVIPVALLTVDMLPLPIELNPTTGDQFSLWNRYLGCQFAVNGDDFTAGAFTIDFLLDPESFQSGPFAYAGGFEVA